MKKTGWVAALMLGSTLLAGTAEAKWRWPWEKADKKPKPAATAAPTAAPAAAQGAALPQEEAFLQTLHDADLKQIALGEQALRKAADPQVKQYAQRLVQDHKRIDETIKAHTLKMGWRLEEPRVNLPSGVVIGKPQGAAPHPEIARLEPMSGASFDREFLQIMVDTHDALLPELGAFQNQESDRAFHSELVKIFADVKHHRMEAKRLLDESLGRERQDVRGTDAK